MRIGRREALELFRRVVSGLVRFHGPDLTVRQLAILSRIHLASGPHTVRGLADQLGVTKAVVVRAIDTLCLLGFVERRPDPRDKRSILIVPALRGVAYMNHIGDLVAAAASQGGLRENTGPVQDGPVQDGPVQDGPAQDGPIHEALSSGHARHSVVPNAAPNAAKSAA